MSRTMNNNSHNNRIEYNVDTINLTSALTGKNKGIEMSVSSISTISSSSSIAEHLPKLGDPYDVPAMTTHTRVQTVVSCDDTPSQPQAKHLSELSSSCWKCCSQTYYATICIILVMIGCPMAAVGSQEEIVWAMYCGIALVLTALLISLVAPNVRGFFTNIIPSRIRNHAVFKRMIKSKVGSKNLPT